MFNGRISLAIAAAFCVAAARPQARLQHPALEGLDPVLLTEGHEVPGKDTLTVQRGRFLYQFSSEETRNRFNKNPERYGIQLDGACARMGPPTGASPDAYFVYKERIYIFGSHECYKRFSADPAKYLASEQPKPAWNPSPETRAEGHALLKKAIESMGGAARWATVLSYIETRHTAGPDGEWTVMRSVRLPDSYREETKRGSNRFGTLVTVEGQYSTYGDEGERLPQSFSQVMLSGWRRDLLPLLLSRGLEVYHTGNSDNADRLAINNRGVISTVLLDPTSGHIAGIAWRGGGPDGFGDFRISYSDYRETEGLQLPFRAEGIFDGKPVPYRSWTVESYRLNPPDIDARLQPPSKVRDF